MNDLTMAEKTFLSVVHFFIICFLSLALAIPSGHEKKKGPVEIGGYLCDNEMCLCHFNLTVTCNFNKSQNVVLKNNSFPVNMREVKLTGAKGLNVERDAFALTEAIKCVEIEDIDQLVIRQKAFGKSASDGVLIFIFNCSSVYIQNNSFPIEVAVRANISQCGYVNLQRNIFSRILHVIIDKVPRLELEEETFYFSGKPHTFKRRHKPREWIHFSNVTVPEIKKKTFGSSGLEIKFQDSVIRLIREAAFSAKEFLQLTFINTEIGGIDKGAFPSESLIMNFTLYNCTVRNIKSEAILSSPSNFQLQHSRFHNVEDGAIHTISANVTITDNVFEKFGLSVHEWNNVNVERNVFNEIKVNAVSFPFKSDADMLCRFIFNNNSINKLSNDGLKFLHDMPGSPHLIVDYQNNFYNTKCTCNIEDWLKNKLSKNVSSLTPYIGYSYCKMGTDSLPDCENLIGYITMKNFTDIFCGNEDELLCQVTKKKYNQSFVHPPGTFTDDDDVQNDDTFESKYLLYLLLLGAIIAIIIIIFCVTCKWVKRNGYCVNVKNVVTPSNTSCAAYFDRLFGLNYGMDTARSISRISVNEYTENHMLQGTRTFNEENTTLVNGASFEELDIIDTKDKATQTLPEELNEEFLVSLREKLHDPETYTEASEQIERLYALVRVEEDCNTNFTNSSNANLDENVYDVIQVPKRITQGKKTKIDMISVKTQTVIFEKVAPISPYNRETALCHDYSEPKDHALNLYSELQENKYSDVNHKYSLLPEGTKPTPTAYLSAIEKSINPTTPSNNKDHHLLSKKRSSAGPSGLLFKSATQRSNKSNHSAASDSSGNKMANRPLPEKPRVPP